MLRCPDTPNRHVNEGGFVQAYILLGLRGIELLGNTKAGWTVKRAFENSWSQKSAPLVAGLLDPLKISSPELEEPSQNSSTEMPLLTPKSSSWMRLSSHSRFPT